METYYCIVKNGIIIIQEAKYIEHGWFIRIENNVISLFEIPYGGGKEIRIDDFNTIPEAINASKQLT